MPGIEVQPFAAEHLDAAAGLLAKRHRRHRQAEPLLPEKIDFRAELDTLWSREGASGAVALRADRIVGYLLGAPRDDSDWGPNMWVEAAGHAVEEPEDARDLYAAAAERWVEDGRTGHYVLLPASEDALIDAWFRVGFGGQHAHGVREVPGHVDVTTRDGFEIRNPTEDEIEALIEVDLALPRHQAASPVFSRRPLRSRDESRREWMATLAGGDEEVTDWRETNLLASRFWPRRGFRRAFLRLYRSIP